MIFVRSPTGLTTQRAHEEEALMRLWLAILMDPDGPLFLMAYRFRRVEVSDEDNRHIDAADLHFYRGFASISD